MNNIQSETLLNKERLPLSMARTTRYCNSMISQARGLMFRRKQNCVMEFSKEKKISLHMFFVFYPIDVLVLNENKKVVEIEKGLKPWTLWKSTEKGKYILETPFEHNYRVGDKVNINA